MIKLGYKIIDLHTHLREDIADHTKRAEEAGVDTLLYMPNTSECLDSLEKIQVSLKQKRYVTAYPVSAITIGRRGGELVDVEKIRPFVAGFSDDGDCLNNLGLLAEVLKTGVLVMAHLEPEMEMAKKYLNILQETGGKLHLQHVSSAKTVGFLRKAKKSGIEFSCETCPHYFTYSCEVEDKTVNPPLGTYNDIVEIKRGLKDGTIDCIASDYAPIPRPNNTGFASFNSFITLSYGLVLEGILTKDQLKDKIYNNPKKILWQSGIKI